MKSHMHVVVHVPKRPENMPDNAELVRLVEEPTRRARRRSWIVNLPSCIGLLMMEGRNGFVGGFCIGCETWPDVCPGAPLQHRQFVCPLERALLEHA
jgi:hypothetical protein